MAEGVLSRGCLCYVGEPKRHNPLRPPDKGLFTRFDAGIAPMFPFCAGLFATAGCGWLFGPVPLVRFTINRITAKRRAGIQRQKQRRVPRELAAAAKVETKTP